MAGIFGLNDQQSDLCGFPFGKDCSRMGLRTGQRQCRYNLSLAIEVTLGGLACREVGMRKFVKSGLIRALIRLTF
jgi:hypothetical protein